MAEFPRSMIDVNRAENDIDPEAIDGVWPTPLAPAEMTVSGFGLVRRLCRNGIPLYRAPLTAAEIQRRIDIYYRPYHDCLQKQISARMKQFGVCHLINAHSMPDRIETAFRDPILFWATATAPVVPAAFTRRAQKILQDMGYRVVLNNPYKGREIVRRYGLEGQGAQALQIEINRKLYLDEVAIEKHEGFAGLRRDMTALFRQLAE